MKLRAHHQQQYIDQLCRIIKQGDVDIAILRNSECTRCRSKDKTVKSNVDQRCQTIRSRHVEVAT
jgi:hypothetical protein